MKTTLGRGIAAILITGIMLSIGNSSCTTDNDITLNAETYITSGSASGSQQTPAVATNGIASLTGTYNTKINTWQYSISWSSLNSAATAIQLYGPSDIGLNGSIITAIAISTPGTSGSVSGSITLTDAQEANLIAWRL